MDVGEILARIEAIDWQLAKPGAMALSRGWSREEVASWAIRANDARQYLVAALVDLRATLHAENQELTHRNLRLAREVAELREALGMALDGTLTDTGDLSGVKESRRLLAISAKEMALRVDLVKSPKPETLATLRAVRRALRKAIFGWQEWKKRHPEVAPPVPPTE
jgi:hypothetical protein